MRVDLAPHIRLIRVNSSNLDRLRQLRNHPVLRAVLAHNLEITAEEQAAWFGNMDFSKNIYFLVYLHETLSGYALLKNIDPHTRTGEPGILLVDETKYGSSQGALLTLSFLDFCHAFFGIDRFEGNVMLGNHRALDNYRWFDTQVTHVDDKMQILASPKPYPRMEKINTLREILKKLEGYTGQMDIYADASELASVPAYTLSPDIRLFPGHG